MSGGGGLVLLTPELPPFAGGVATYCHRLATLLHDSGVPTAVVAPAPRAGDGAAPAMPFPVLRVADPPLLALRQVCRLAGLLRAVRRHRPRMLWAADWRAGVLVVPVARLLGRPAAVTVYGSELLMAQERAVRRRLARWVLSRCEVVLAISRYAAGLARELGAAPQRLTVVPLGVDPVGTPPSADEVERLRRRYGLTGRRVILTLARLTPRKGHDVVLRALPAVLRAVPDTVYLVAGSGDDRPRLEALAHRLGVDGAVVWAGRVAEAEKAAVYRLCDVFVMPSRREGYLVEGFGLALLEAGAHGRPVVGGRHGGVPEAVLEGETGLLVDPEDPDELAAAIVRLLQDRPFAERLGESARRRVERDASWRRVADDTLAALRAAWEGGSR